ncbi:MAG: hypothetical protein U0Z75_09220 [Deinococcaceae bacterium]
MSRRVATALEHSQASLPKINLHVFISFSTLSGSADSMASSNENFHNSGGSEKLDFFKKINVGV